MRFRGFPGVVTDSRRCEEGRHYTYANVIRLLGLIKGFSQAVAGKVSLQGDIGFFIGFISQP